MYLGKFPLVLMALVGCTSAFLRPPTITPLLREPYTIYGPDINLTTSMTIGYGDRVQDYWYASYLSADNGHEYFAVASIGGNPLLGTSSVFVSLLNIETGSFYGNSYPNTATLSNTTYDITGRNLRMWSSTSDLVSVQHAESDDPHATYNLTFEPRGPNLYHGGSGIFWWGTGTTYEIAYPQLWVTGTLTINGTETKVIPEKSLAWMDRQWGPGFAIKGWWWFNLYLPNGWIIAAWRTRAAVDNTPKLSSFATVLFPDGHHEVHALNENVYESDPWISPITNVTYYGKFQLTVPTLDLVMDVKMPHKVGEMASRQHPDPSQTLCESFVKFAGRLKGESITGFGLVESFAAVA